MADRIVRVLVRPFVGCFLPWIWPGDRFAMDGVVSQRLNAWCWRGYCRFAETTGHDHGARVQGDARWVAPARLAVCGAGRRLRRADVGARRPGRRFLSRQDDFG